MVQYFSWPIVLILRKVSMFAIGSMLTIPFLFILFGETMLEKIRKKPIWRRYMVPGQGMWEIKAKKRFSPPMSIDSPYLSGSPQVAGPNRTGLLREGLKKKHVFYPHFVDKGGGSSKVDKREGTLMQQAHLEIFFFQFQK